MIIRVGGEKLLMGYIPIHDYQFLTFDVIGSPFGSSSPLNDTHFPEKLTLRDIVRANERGIQALGYDKINILIGEVLEECKQWNYFTINSLK